MSESLEPLHAEPPLTIKVEYSPFVNFAMQQNAVPLLRAVTVTNVSDKQITDLRVRVWSDPPVIAEKTLRVDAINPGTSYAFSNLAVTLLREPLRKQSEREMGHLWVETSANGIPAQRQPLSLSVLAYNEWYGISSLPEIIAAHVLPNDLAVERILAEASKILQEKTKDSSLSGYQSGDKGRAYAQAAAIYWAAARQKISYVNPPASFEETGQKIRTPEHLLDRKLGTCMDITALLAACFEQVGLRPLIVLVEQHAFPGVWLVDKSFDAPVTVHASILLNRIALGELLVVESTAITKAPLPSFKAALELAGRHLQDDARFRFAIDIKAARKIGILPLSLTESVSRPVDEDLDLDGGELSFSDDLDAPKEVTVVDTIRTTRKPREEESAADRLARWKTSLLDLSLRNRLLNFKDSKKAIPLICPDIASLEDGLANNEAFRVRSKPDSWGEADPRDAALHLEQTGGDALAEFLREEMTQHRLHAAVTESDLAARLTEIERTTRSGLEEGGANTLFLTLGYLVWTESAASDIERRAPILLIPMKIERQSVREGFRIQRIDEESRINIALLQKLRVDFGITIEDLDPLPEDSSGLDVPKILRVIREAIKRQPRWKVAEEASLSILTFSRFLMWLDLEANAEALKKNVVVRHLIETSNELFDPSATFPDLETLDDTYSPTDTFCPLHADSSQLRAIFAATEGRTFVLQGPPGTGKSQTITNLIAHCLTKEKRILFVAQKRAALDVVHKRLTDVGLGPFCLELHSNKTTKESFRAQLREALNVAGTGTSEYWEAETNRLAELRQILNEYVRDLHQPRTFGKSAYWAISRLIRHEGQKKVSLNLGETTNRTEDEYQRMKAAVSEIVEAARISGDPSHHPLKSVRLSKWTYGVEEEALNLIRALYKPLNDLRSIAAAVLPELGLKVEEVTLSDLKVVQQRCEALSADSIKLLQNIKQVSEVVPAAIRLLRDDKAQRPETLPNDSWPEFQNAISQWLNQAIYHRNEIRSLIKCLQSIRDDLSQDRYPSFCAVRWEVYGWNTQALKDLHNLLTQLIDLMNRSAMEIQNFESIYSNWAKMVSAESFLPSGLLQTKDWSGLCERLKDSIRRGKARDNLRKELLVDYSAELLELNVNHLLQLLYIKDKQWFFRRWQIGIDVRKQIKRVQANKKKIPDFAKIIKDLERAASIQRENHRLATEDHEAILFFHSLWNQGEAEWTRLEEVLGWSHKFSLARNTALDRDTVLQKSIDDVSRQITEIASGLISHQNELGGIFAGYGKCYSVFLESQRRLENVLQLSDEWGSENEKSFFENIDSILGSLSSNLTRLREWSHYQSARAVAVMTHLSDLVEALEQGEVQAKELELVFEGSFADWWARNVLKSFPSLAGFIGERHELKIHEFHGLEAKISDLTKKESFARIASGLPRVAVASQRTPASSEAGLLQRFTQGGRKTIRRIFKECPNALARYKPCVLMSPLSVAQFIGVDFPKFDMVVFDEASQMPTYEAIGAIARGEQLIVVGDSKQLPPTTFFERQKGDEEYSEEDLPEELESILEEAEAAGIKPLRLDWHYRSRHESLIAFSNRQYYNNRLHTFPSALAEHPRLGVKWREVPDGIYDHGKSRTNRREAEVVVAEIVRRLRDPQEQGNSLGVVTFSMAQQQLVEDLLDAARGEHPEIEPYFTTVGEPVFVKNLETVQGDERDVILFSICYGPDAAGIVRMKFGPLNIKGGERRLNVAITRARKQLLVFSRLRPEQIDLSRTQAVGVHHLRTFLDYAKRGPAALTEEVARTSGGVESPFEQSVFDELTKRSWRVDVQVGCSGYRIDLAVRDPDAPGRYLLGVECDGANYHSAKSARDRDQIRQTVLEGLGWHLHRIWSTDWWLQRPKEIAKLEEAIMLAKQRVGTANDVDLNPPANVLIRQEPKTESVAETGESPRYTKVAVTIEKRSFAPPPAEAQLPGQSTYKRYDPGVRSFQGEIHDPENTCMVGNLVLLIARIESPILFEVLCSEVASCWGLQKAGNRIRDIVRGAAKHQELVIKRVGAREFIWTKELAEKPYKGFRVPDERDPKPRQSQEICPEETANAAAQVLAQHISMGFEDLARETANVFGIRRLGTNVRSSIDEGIEMLKMHGGCRVDAENLIAT